MELDKQNISAFIETNCQRQLYLSMIQDQKTVRKQHPKRLVRPALQVARQLGDEWEAEKINDLVECFGSGTLVGDVEPKKSIQVKGQTLPVYQEKLLKDALEKVVAGQFIVQGEYRVPDLFKDQWGLRQYESKLTELGFKNSRPDLIWVRQPQTFDSYVDERGEVVKLPEGDRRLQLQVIDIKLAAEPSLRYYVEVVYYVHTLAAWLMEHGWSNDFVVVPHGAIWPGSYESSGIIKLAQDMRRNGDQPILEQLQQALTDDFEIVPYRTIAPRLATFFERDLPAIITTENWLELNWHINLKCGKCDFLGIDLAEDSPDKHPNHCHVEATRNGLVTQVAYLGRGTRGQLEDQGIYTTQALRNASPEYFEESNQLRANRSVLQSRANALLTDMRDVLPERRTAALPSSYECDLQIFLTVDFDASTGLTYAFGISSIWWSKEGGKRIKDGFKRTAYLVPDRTPEAELEQLLKVLEGIEGEVKAAEVRLKPSPPRVQFYIWDSIQAKHIRRVMGRHINNEQIQKKFQRLLWRFPPEEVMPDAELELKSPVSVVKEVIRSIVGLPVPYDYSLLKAGRALRPDSLSPNVFNVPSLFESGLGDQIPYERAHEIWSNRGYSSQRTGRTIPWNELVSMMNRTVKAKLLALQVVVESLEKELRSQRLLLKPKRVKLTRRRGPTGVSVDGNLLLNYAKLSDVSDALAIRAIQAMDVEEREGRYHTLVLTERVEGREANEFLESTGISSASDVWIYRIRPQSSEAKFKRGDFLCVFSPMDDPKFLHRKIVSVVPQTPRFNDLINDNNRYHPLDYFMQVTILEIDREKLLVALRVKDLDIVQALEDEGIADLSANVVVDKIHKDYWVRKLEKCIRDIGNPSIAEPAPESLKALNRNASPSTQAMADSNLHTIHKFLWDAAELASEQSNLQSNLVETARWELERKGITLNARQWAAWQRASKHRLTLIWGPPGTGKSRTLRALIVGLVYVSSLSGKPLRVLVSSTSYRAFDNVLLESVKAISDNFSGIRFSAYRLRSSYQERPRELPAPLRDVENAPGSTTAGRIRKELKSPSKPVVIGATPSQVFNLVTQHGKGKSIAEYFDVIIIDEASQMDVGQSLPLICAATPEAQVILAGDPMQLGPIQSVTPPKGTEYLLGSVYTYIKTRFKIALPADAEQILAINYRSNAAIVAYGRTVCYEDSYQSQFPDLALAFNSNPSQQPADWPANIPWSSEWNQLLAPEVPVVCFAYSEGKSGQSNRFESQAVASLIRTLWSYSPRKALLNEEEKGGCDDPHTFKSFFEEAVGIVTPHTAQRAQIISDLRIAFSADLEQTRLIRDAVDTVERFQGQQRQVIIASFTVSDPDLVAMEDEFLLMLSRFNVMASRPRAKLIVLVSDEIIDHLSSDKDVLEESVAVKLFAHSFCKESRPTYLPYIRPDGTTTYQKGIARAYPGFQ